MFDRLANAGHDTRCVMCKNPLRVFWNSWPELGITWRVGICAEHGIRVYSRYALDEPETSL